MQNRLTLKEGIVLVLFFTVQFFWLSTVITHSEDARLSERGERAVSAVPDVPAVHDIAAIDTYISLGSAGVPAVSPPPNTVISSESNPFETFTRTNELVNAVTPQLTTSDLGSQIKYCIVFPLLEDSGLPTGNVPVCPLSPTPPGPPPPPGSPRLTVSKVVVNNNGGMATTSNFTLLVGSTTVLSGVERVFAAGDYSVSEATTTITVGTTTTTYLQSFSGACDPLGRVVLAAGDRKTCTITNDDKGPDDEQGGHPGDGNGGDDDNGNGGDRDGDDNGNGDRGGITGGRYGPPGQVLGTTTPPFVGGAPAEPGAPNAGAGGERDGTLGLLIFSFVSSLLGTLYLRLTRISREVAALC